MYSVSSAFSMLFVIYSTSLLDVMFKDQFLDLNWPVELVLTNRFAYPKVFCTLFFKDRQFLSHILHVYSAFKSMPNYKVSFSYS